MEHLQIAYDLLVIMIGLAALSIVVFWASRTGESDLRDFSICLYLLHAGADRAGAEEISVSERRRLLGPGLVSALRCRAGTQPCGDRGSHPLLYGGLPGSRPGGQSRPYSL